MSSILHNSVTFLRILIAILVQKWTEACTGSLGQRDKNDATTPHLEFATREGSCPKL